MSLFGEINAIRMDDHNHYHNNKINRKLHFFSGLAFLYSYYLVLFLSDYVHAVLIAWLVAMPSRQIGHFVFEPSDPHTESIKTGYNVRLKKILHAVSYTTPILLYSFSKIDQLNLATM